MDIDHDRSSSLSPWLRRYGDAPTGAPRLVCLPHAGGSASTFAPLARLLHPRVDVLAVQYPGRQDRIREPCLEDIHDLARRIASELRSVSPDPVALFGHSMGATVAFEVARELAADGAHATGLFVSANTAPSTHRDEAFWHEAPEDWAQELHRLGGTDAELLKSDAFLQLILPSLRGDYKAVRAYRYSPGPPLSLPIVAFAGDKDPIVDAEQIAQWRNHTTNDFQMHILSGGHFYFNEHVGTVAGLISSALSMGRPETIIQ